MKEEVKSERIKRGENYYNEIYPEIHQSIQKKEKRETKNNNRKITRNLIIALGASGLLIIGAPIAKNVKYQRDIDKENAEFMTIVPDNIKISEKEREDTKKYLKAVDDYLNNSEITWQQKSEAENIIVEFMVSDEGKKVAESVAYTKINQAKMYGDYEYFEYENGTDDVYWINDRVENEKGFRINGVDNSTYSTKYQLFTKKIPKNLAALTEDILDYGDWKDKEQCIKDGINLGTDLETVMYEYYLLDEKGNINRVNEKDFDDKKEEYKEKIKEEDDKQREDIYEKYGIASVSYTEIENDLEK